MTKTPVNNNWDENVDVLVVGSGAGGLVAALVAAEAHGSVVVIEKSCEYGGTSATSGGGIWIPNSRIAREAGHEDSEEEAFRYIRGLSADNVPDSLIRAYVQRAPLMLDWLVENTPVRYDALPYPDYHVENDGGKSGYRTHLPQPYDGRKLGANMLTLRSASPAASLWSRINWGLGDTYTLLFRPKGWKRSLARMLWRYGKDIPHRLRSRKDRNLTLGTALVGGLRAALDQHRVPLWLETALVELVRSNGTVVGAVVRRRGKLLRLQTRRGVILAAGGFERNAALRARYLPGSADPTFSGGQRHNTGDAIVAAEIAGAALRNMQSTWSAPVFRVPGEERSRLSTIERALPGCIIVNQAGVRYVNEAASYHLVGREMVAQDRAGAGTSPSWVIFDAAFRHRYPMGPLLPLIPDALQPKAVRAILKRASSIAALARQIDVPSEALVATVARFNDGAAKGVDPDFHRGEAAYDRMYGDPRVQPNPTLAPIVAAPFYAFPIYGGDIGTNGGVVADADGRACDADGRPIGGLYAIGNCAASVMGESYPGAGSTLGPAMTFGFAAGRHIMGANAAIAL